jgi:hypothetical protein
MGLLLAFTFSGAGERFEKRRELIIEETNAIGTAYLRLDLLPADAREPLREKFRQYVEARLAYDKALANDYHAEPEAERFHALQQEIWNAAIPAAVKQSIAAVTMLTPALNQMIDLTTTRTQIEQAHPPPAVYIMLIVLLLLCSMLAGYELSLGPVRRWMLELAYCAILAATVYVVLDYEFPRIGVLRLDPADRMLMELRATMK